jgi:hypothetical protein
VVVGHPAPSSFWTVRLAAASTLALLAFSSSVTAASPERVAYVRKLEAICKPGVERTQRAVSGVREDIRAERLLPASGKLEHAGRIFAATVRAAGAVPRPPADAAQLAKWFSQLQRQQSYLRRAATALRAEQITRYQRNSVLFVHNGNLANDIVLVFGFNYCRFKFSRFER